MSKSHLNTMFDKKPKLILQFFKSLTLALHGQNIIDKHYYHN